MIAPAHWSLVKRICFRFAFSFWAAFCLNSGISSFLFWVWPWLNNRVWDALDWPFTKLTLWAGHHVFHLTGVAAEFHPTSSSDTALSWVRAFVFLVTAFAAGTVWSVISEWRGRRFEYRTLNQWLRLGLRFMLGTAMLSYGFHKVFPLQFPPPTPERLAVTYADSSPMGLLWRFMGSSRLYSFFGGVAEVIPGCLLLFRRTVTLGALGAFAVLLNVVALNLGYDVGVKLYSMELLLMAAFLLLPDLQPLWLFFVRKESAHLSRGRVPRSERLALRLAAIGMQVLTIGWILYDNGLGTWRMWHGGRTPLSGSWKVEGSSDALSQEGWTSVSLNTKIWMRIWKNGLPLDRNIDIDSSTHTLRIFGDFHDQNATDRTPVAVLHWAPEHNGLLQLTGTWQGQPATLLLHRTLADSKLETRGFHWVQEDGFNR